MFQNGFTVFGYHMYARFFQELRRQFATGKDKHPVVFDSDGRAVLRVGVPYFIGFDGGKMRVEFNVQLIIIHCLMNQCCISFFEAGKLFAAIGEGYPVVVAKEYPELKKSLDPMNTALESVLKLMPEFDKFVKNTLPA